MFFDEIFASLYLCRVEQVDFSNFGNKVRAKFNGVIIGMMGGSWSWVLSEKTSSKSLHHSGIVGSTTWVVWEIWVEMVVLLIDSPPSQASHFWSLLEIFWSASRPNHYSRYHWGISSEEGELSDFGMETVFDIQSILGSICAAKASPEWLLLS